MFANSVAVVMFPPYGAYGTECAPTVEIQHCNADGGLCNQNIRKEELYHIVTKPVYIAQTESCCMFLCLYGSVV